MNKKALHRNTLSIAMGLCLASLTPMAMAQDGAVVGRSEAGAQVKVRNPETGFTRTVTADANGNYRFPFLPVGDYTLEASKDGVAVGQRRMLTVSLGTTTDVNTAVIADGVATLGTVQVHGARVISRVDVHSTESATNVTRQEIERLPVNQDIASVAVLAPGVQKGDASFGGLSFGGSSVAENSFYINGLNVTDFYNRNGFSSAPFAFYKEFQVKTGGYSVEFGRSTGGVINAVTRSGTNEFESGAELTMEPRAWQSDRKDRYRENGTRYITASKDNYSLAKLNLFASGPLVRDRLFFFAMHEARDFQPRNTNIAGTTLSHNQSDDGFWGTKIDWQINDNHLLEFMAFSDQNSNLREDYRYDFATDTRGRKTDEVYVDSGGRNWNATYTGYLTNDLSMKLMYGENDRESFQRALSDIECNRVVQDSRMPPQQLPLGCTTSSQVQERLDNRKAARMDFEWILGDHRLRFGLDREQNVSNYDRYYPGPGALFYNIYPASPGATIENGGVIPAGVNGYVRARRYEIGGQFETINAAYYLEDNWSATPNLLLNLGLRMEAFDNKDGTGNSYIKMDGMLAPRFGFSWDMRGDGTTKVFGNIGRYFLPVANVINIKQAGGLLDERTYYAFGGYETRTRNGVDYLVPILGSQIGPVDNSQGDGTVGDLRSEVDRDMDPVYQDELILGFQSKINETWSWGVSGTYRKLNNAIDDMNITATAACGRVGAIGWVMANPGEVVTVWGDTNCDGRADGYVDIDTSREGWALYDARGNYLGQRGWESPERTYKALEFQVDRAWDGKWGMNASYTLAYSRGNAEGPVNSDTNFDDTGRTENFDDPWVNFMGDGPLANDRRHQFKMRGSYAFTDNWLVGGSFDLHSGGPISGRGRGNPFDRRNYHSWYICVSNCTDPDSTRRVYEHSPRGSYGTMPWTHTFNTNVTYQRALGNVGLRVKLAVYNLFNQQREVNVDQRLQTTISNSTNPFFLEPVRFQSPRYAQLTVSVDF